MKPRKIGLELRSLNNLIRRYFQLSCHKKEIDSITGNNGWIINFLAENDDRDIFQKDIEDFFTITRSTASKVLSLMEQKGLIQRQTVSQDARLKKIVLTPKALQLRNMMMADAKRMDRTLIRGFSPQEVETLFSYLERMKKNISDLQEKK